MCFSYRSNVSVQVLFCIILVFFNVYLIMMFTIRQRNISNVTPQIREKINNIGNESFVCDLVRRKNHRWRTAESAAFEQHRLNVLHAYCDMLPSPRNNWIRARNYSERDVVFVIYTGAAFYHNRATAMRDTWLSRVTHKYFLSSTPYPSLPVTVIKGAGEDYLSNVKKLYVGLQIAYREHHLSARWYYLAGCDTFVNVPHILKRLDGLDHTKPLIVGGYMMEHTCVAEKNSTPYNVTYPSGGAGFFLSSKLMELMYPRFNYYFEKLWPLTMDWAYTDVALNCFAYTFGVNATYVPGFWAFPPNLTAQAAHDRRAMDIDQEPNTFHYIQPTEMHILDEFYVLQHIDRLANDGNLLELVQFSRRFAVAHYELLRIKKSECTLPPVPSPTK